MVALRGKHVSDLARRAALRGEIAIRGARGYLVKQTKSGTPVLSATWHQTESDGRSGGTPSPTTSTIC